MIRTWLVIFSLASGTIDAAESGAIVGIGTKQCAHFNKKATAQEVRLALSWAQGYTSGLNQLAHATTGRFRKVPAEPKDFLNLIASYCEAFPKVTVYRAATEVWKKLPLADSAPTK